MTSVERTRLKREEQIDRDVAATGDEKSARIELGLALLNDIAIPGIAYTTDEIALWCGCTNSAIYAIEQRALRKLRNRFRFMKDDRLREMMEHLFDERRPAQRPIRQ